VREGFRDCLGKWERQNKWGNDFVNASGNGFLK